MFVGKRKYEELEKKYSELRVNYAILQDSLNETRIAHNKYLNNLKDSIARSNVVPYSKVKEGSIVVGLEGKLRRVVKIEGNWCLTTSVHDKLRVDPLVAFIKKFGNGPVSKQDLIEYMKEKNYYNG